MYFRLIEIFMVFLGYLRQLEDCYKGKNNGIKMESWVVVEFEEF